jgi:hypothetical protein
MRLLLDENLPHQLRTEIQGHEVITTAYMGWSGIENGKLLALAAGEGFDALITNDRGLEYEQNAASLPLAIVILRAKANTLEAIRPLYRELQDALKRLQPRELVKVGGS